MRHRSANAVAVELIPVRSRHCFFCCVLVERVNDYHEEGVCSVAAQGLLGDLVATSAAGEELTPKELEILRLLQTRLTRAEIVARLYVSVNTVKTHQRAMYRKLRVEHRSAAVGRARKLGLL